MMLHTKYQGSIIPEDFQVSLYKPTTVNSEIFARVYFRETSHRRSFVKLKPSRNGTITLFTDILIPCTSREFLTSQTCLLMLFAKIKFSQKFPNLEYVKHVQIIT